jgi:mono/diheme cytochrome c family protein
MSVRHLAGSRVAIAAGIAGLALGFAGVSIGNVDPPNATSRASSALIERGRYLAAAGDCISCHTRTGGKPYAGGRPLDTPFGVIYSANITPDAVSGIGGWSEAQFSRAVREGVAKDGTHLYPALPYTAYTKVTDEDVHAIWAYVRSLQPVRYSPPPHQLSFPFNVRSLLGAWNLMFFQDGRYVYNRSRSAQWNRGAYLVQGLGHCGACHTARNAAGGEKLSQALTGGEYLDEVADEIVDGKIIPLDERTVRPWAAANLTPARGGLAAWSIEEIAEYLATGHSARAAAFGPMSEVVGNSTSHLTADDNRAIALYLKSLPAPTQETAPLNRERMKAGEIVFTARCGDCHLPSGLGIPRAANNDASKTAPPLAGSAALQAPSPATLLNVILYGAHEAQATAAAWPYMSGFELSVGLDDEQIAALATYVRSSWGNHADPVDAAAVARQR